MSDESVKPCGPCPWVSTDQRDKDAVGSEPMLEALDAGAWFCCHVDMGTCRGAVLVREKRARKTEKETSDA